MHTQPRGFALPALVMALALMVSSIAVAQTETVSYPGLGIEPGTPGGTLTLALGEAPPRFFYYGEISVPIQTLAQQMFDSLVEYDLEAYEQIITNPKAG